MKNEYEVTEKLYMSWGIENMFKGIHLKFMIFWTVMAFLIFICCMIYGFEILFVFFIVYCLYRAFFHNIVLTKGQYKKLVQSLGKESWKRVVLFKDDCISVHDVNHTFDFSYLDITNIREKNNKIWLDTNKKTVIRLYKDAFVGGDYAEFLNLIKAKNSDLSIKSTIQ